MFSKGDPRSLVSCKFLDRNQINTAGEKSSLLLKILWEIWKFWRIFFWTQGLRIDFFIWSKYFNYLSQKDKCWLILDFYLEKKKKIKKIINKDITHFPQSYKDRILTHYFHFDGKKICRKNVSFHRQKKIPSRWCPLIFEIFLRKNFFMVHNSLSNLALCNSWQKKWTTEFLFGTSAFNQAESELEKKIDQFW